MAGESQMIPESQPDPSVLTTDQLRWGLKAERDWAEGQFEIRDQRFAGMDKAAEVLNETVNRVPTDLQKAIGNVRELMEEKFMGVAQQFSERDTRAEKVENLNKVALDAAFAAQKEAAAKQDESNQKAIDKSEKSTNETIIKNSDAAEARAKAQDDKIEDLKERVTRAEAGKAGGADAIRVLMAVISLIGGLIVAAIVVATFVLTKK